jgi:aldose 1-epimerase
MKLFTLLLALPFMSQAASYSASKAVVDGIEVIRLSDPDHKTEVSVVPSIGNNAYEMKVNGKNLFWFPFQSLADFKAKPVLAANPFLAPWANRLDQDALFANGNKYLLNPGLGNIRRDPNGKPIHGLLLFSPDWKVVAAEADGRSAWVTSRLEYWKRPELMAQFPIAHTIEMTYRLSGGSLEVETVLRNRAGENLPVAVGYHPYFRLHDAARDDWKVHVAAREQLVLSDQLVPTGEHKPLSLPDPASLGSTQLDDVFTGLVRGSDGRAVFSVQGKSEKISVVYGPKYTVAIVYAPKTGDFICFEPMSAITNAFNLAQAGIYKELQSVPPDGEWRESYWIVPSGF